MLKKRLITLQHGILSYSHTYFSWQRPCDHFLWSFSIATKKTIVWIVCVQASKQVRPTLDKGPGSNLLGTNLDWFEANCILELDSTLVPSLIPGSPNQELSF